MLSLWIKYSEKFLFYSDSSPFSRNYSICRIFHGNFHTCVDSAQERLPLSVQ